MFGYGGGSTSTAGGTSNPNINYNPTEMGNGGIHTGMITIGNTNQSGDASSTGGSNDQSFSLDMSGGDKKGGDAPAASSGGESGGSSSGSGGMLGSLGGLGKTLGGLDGMFKLQNLNTADQAYTGMYTGSNSMFSSGGIGASPVPLMQLYCSPMQAGCDLTMADPSIYRRGIRSTPMHYTTDSRGQQHFYIL